MPAKAMTSPPSPSIGRTKRRAARRARRAFGGPSSKSPSATLPSASPSIRQRVGPARLVTPARDRKPDRARCRCCRDHTMRPCRRYARSSRPSLERGLCPARRRGGAPVAGRTGVWFALQPLYRSRQDPSPACPHRTRHQHRQTGCLVVRYSAGQNSPVPLCCADGRGQLIGLAEFANSGAPGDRQGVDGESPLR